MLFVPGSASSAGPYFLVVASFETLLFCPKLLSPRLGLQSSSLRLMVKTMQPAQLEAEPTRCTASPFASRALHVYGLILIRLCY